MFTNRILAKRAKTETEPSGVLVKIFMKAQKERENRKKRKELVDVDNRPNAPFN